MTLILDALIEILKKPTIGDIVLEFILFAAPLWVAVFVGLVVGWAWKPRWVAGLGREEKGKPAANSYNCGLQLVLPSWASLKDQISSFLTCFVPVQISEKKEKVFDLSSAPCDKKELVVDYEDLRNLSALVETEDGGPAWIHMMDKSLPTMSYQAWRRDPATGPPQYRSRSVFEDATPEVVRDFFWDDEFRIKNKWDDMLLYQASLEECSVTGTMIVHWIRKFPFFCSDREYTIARRIWEVDGAYYCVTKGVPFPSLPRRNKPRRVDLYYSSWCIRSVESPRQGDGRKTACEVLLFHYEDMGIPWELAKLGVRQGMWSCVKKIEPGLRAYQAGKKSGEPLSHSAAIAQINTKVSSEYLRSLGSISDTSQEIVDAEKDKEKEEKPWVSNMPKFLIVGGAVALACTLDRGLLTKAVIFGVARRFAKIGRRL